MYLPTLLQEGRRQTYTQQKGAAGSIENRAPQSENSKYFTVPWVGLRLEEKKELLEGIIH